MNKRKSSFARKAATQLRVQGREALAVLRGKESPEGLGGPKPATASGGNRQAERRESQGAMKHRDYASSPEKSEFSQSLWAQRSA